MKPKGSLPCSQKPTIVSSLSQINPIKSSYPIYLRSISILSYHLLLGLPNGVFPLGFPTKTLHAFLFSSDRVIRFDIIAVTIASNSDDPCNNSQSIGTVAGSRCISWPHHLRTEAQSASSVQLYIRLCEESNRSVVDRPTSLFPTLASVIARSADEGHSNHWNACGFHLSLTFWALWLLGSHSVTPNTWALRNYIPSWWLVTACHKDDLTC